jgi:opine dehydrogenase
MVITVDLAEALERAEAIIVCMPALGHELAARALARAGVSVPVLLNPGHTCGALHFRAIFIEEECELPPLAELSTLTFVARKYTPGRVTISGTAEQVRGSSLPGGEEAVTLAHNLFPSVRYAADVLATSLANVNLVLHPPGAVLAAAWVEATGGDFFFYSQAVTPGVARVIEALDGERRAVAAAFGHDLPSLTAEMAAIGTADREAAERNDFREAIARGEANRLIRAPDSLEHRYYREDFGYALLPFLELAAVAGVQTPIASALFNVGWTLVGPEIFDCGLTRKRLRIANMTRKDLLATVRNDQRAEVGQP